MIIACISAYQDAGFIDGAIKSCIGKVDRIIVVDGAYRGFPVYDAPWSTDGTVEIAESLGAEVIQCYQIWESQEEKRNQYLIGEIGDWYLIIDSDERLEGEITIGGFDGYKIRVEPGTAFLRLIKHTPGLRYNGGHSVLFDDDGYIDPHQFPLMKSCVLRHLKADRDGERKARKRMYYSNQYDHEHPFRELYEIP